MALPQAEAGRGEPSGVRAGAVSVVSFLHGMGCRPHRRLLLLRSFSDDAFSVCKNHQCVTAVGAS